LSHCKAWRQQRAGHRARESRHGWVSSLRYASHTTASLSRSHAANAPRTDYRGVSEAAGRESKRSVTSLVKTGEYRKEWIQHCSYPASLSVLSKRIG
jgi:hypothetical protein